MDPRESQERPDPEHLTKPELDALAEILGFQETEDLLAIREAAQEAFLSGDTRLVAEMTSRYYELGQAVVDQASDQDRELALIGFSIALGNLHRNSGRLEACIDDLETAKTYAQQRGYGKLFIFLEEAIQQAEEQLAELTA